MKKLLPLIIFFVISTFVVTKELIVKTQRSLASSEQINHNHKLYEKLFNEMAFKTTEGKEIKLSDYKDKVLIVNFWASWCLPCMKEFPSLVNLKAQYPKKVQIIGINNDQDNQLKMISKTSKQFNFNFDNIADTQSKITSDIFLFDDIPASIIYKNGKVHEVSKSERDFNDEKLKKLIEE